MDRREYRGLTMTIFLSGVALALVGAFMKESGVAGVGVVVAVIGGSLRVVRD